MTLLFKCSPLLFLLFTSSLVAQQATQSVFLAPVGLGAANEPQQSYTLTLTTKPGDTLFLVANPAPMVTETGNTWTPVPGAAHAWSAPSLGASETVTLSYSTPTYAFARLLEFSGQLVVDAAATETNGSGLMGWMEWKNADGTDGGGSHWLMGLAVYTRVK